MHAVHAPDLDPDALRALPRIREGMLTALLARLGGSHGHVLIVGPEGSGRGLMLRQLALAVEREQLDRWIVVAPAMRPLLRASDFWVDLARRLVPAAFVQGLPPEEEARTRIALDILDGMARVEARRILVLWENIDEDLDRLAQPTRATTDVLQGGHAITVVATATHPLSTAGPIERSLAQCFDTMGLSPLARDEAEQLALALGPPFLQFGTFTAHDSARLRALTTLLGAWPATVARWVEITGVGGAGTTVAGRPGDDAATDLLIALSFAANAQLRLLRGLPTQARAVLESLAWLEGPSTAHELSVAMGLDVNAVSSQLSRLGKLEFVEAKRRPDVGRAAFVVRDRPLALWLLARGPGRLRLCALARQLAITDATLRTSGPNFDPLLMDDLSRCGSLVKQSRAEEIGAPLSRFLERAEGFGLRWADLFSALWPLVVDAADVGASLLIADELEESTWHVDSWLLVVALRGPRGAVTRLLPEAVAPVLALMDALSARR